MLWIRKSPISNVNPIQFQTTAKHPKLTLTMVILVPAYPVVLLHTNIGLNFRLLHCFPFTTGNCCCVFRQPCLQVFAHVFIDRPQNCAQSPDLVSFACWIVTECWSFTRKSVPDLVIRALNRARILVVIMGCYAYGYGYGRSIITSK